MCGSGRLKFRSEKPLKFNKKKARRDSPRAFVRFFLCVFVFFVCFFICSFVFYFSEFVRFTFHFPEIFLFISSSVSRATSL